MSAARWGRPMAARHLLERGADPRSTRADQSCPLYDAFFAEDLEMMALLIQNGAGPVRAFERARRSGLLEAAPSAAMEALSAAAQAQEIGLSINPARSERVALRGI